MREQYTYTFEKLTTECGKTPFHRNTYAQFKVISQTSLMRSPEENAECLALEARSFFSTRQLSVERIQELLEQYPTEMRIDLGSWGVHRHQLAKAYDKYTASNKKPGFVQALGERLGELRSMRFI